MEKLRILIVEDEPLIASGLSICLKDLGHQVLDIAYTGKEALELALALKPDLLLMDINIPDLDGIIVMERLNREVSIPCVFVTGYSDQELLRRAQEVNAYGYIIKPVDINDLNAAIQIAISRFREKENLNSSLKKSKQALEERKMVERAKGLLMDEYDMKEAQAMRFLQKKSAETNKKLSVIARDIVESYRKLYE